MQKLLENQTLPEFAFPELVKRHLEQPKTLLNYFKQVQEIYMYTFFYKTPMKTVKRMQLDGIDGFYIGAIDNPYETEVLINDNQPLPVESFFDSFKYAPIPFIFASDFCLERKGIFSIENGIIMDINTGSEIGIDFIAGNVLSEKAIENYYIGFILNKNDL
ncbi:hypothetical protein NUSPORA_01320 [Nucleospora cyclopteri]